MLPSVSSISSAVQSNAAPPQAASPGLADLPPEIQEHIVKQVPLEDSRTIYALFRSSHTLQEVVRRQWEASRLLHKAGAINSEEMVEKEFPRILADLQKKSLLPSLQVPVLTKLAEKIRYFQENRRLEVVDTLKHQTDALQDEAHKADVHAAVVCAISWLPLDQRWKTFEVFDGEADALKDDASQAKVRAALVGQVGIPYPSEAAALKVFNDSLRRADALRGEAHKAKLYAASATVIMHLDTEQMPEALKTLLSKADGLQDNAHKAEVHAALAKLITWLPDPDQQLEAFNALDREAAALEDGPGKGKVYADLFDNLPDMPQGQMPGVLLKVATALAVNIEYLPEDRRSLVFNDLEGEAAKLEDGPDKLNVYVKLLSMYKHLPNVQRLDALFKVSLGLAKQIGFLPEVRRLNAFNDLVAKGNMLPNGDYKFKLYSVLHTQVNHLPNDKRVEALSKVLLVLADQIRFLNKDNRLNYFNALLSEGEKLPQDMKAELYIRLASSIQYLPETNQKHEALRALEEKVNALDVDNVEPTRRAALASALEQAGESVPEMMEPPSKKRKET